MHTFRRLIPLTAIDLHPTPPNSNMTSEKQHHNTLDSDLCHRLQASRSNPTRRDFLRAASGLALVAGAGALAGCSSAQEPGLRIATNQWLGYELLYLSQEIDHPIPYPEHPRVRMVELLSSTDSLQALAAGTADGAGLTLDEALTARAAGIDIKIVLVFDFSAGADVLLTRPEIKTLADLKHKRIGVEQTGVGALMLDSALKQAGLSAAEVQVVSLTVDQQLQAYRAGKIDAVVTFEPMASKIAAAGGQRRFDSNAIPGSIVDVLAISTQALQANPETTRHLLAHFFDALAYLRQHPESAAERMAPRLGISAAEVITGYRGLKLPDIAENRRLLSGSPSPLETTATKLMDLMLREKLLARPIEVTQFIADTYLPQVQS